MHWIGWTALAGLLAVWLTLDPGLLRRYTKLPPFHVALAWTGFWVSMAVAFSAVVYWSYDQRWDLAGAAAARETGGDAAWLYLNAYLLAKSLSLDNVFIIALVCTYFKLAPPAQHRVLDWGAGAALLLRALLALLAVAMLQWVDWLRYVLGALLILSAMQLLIARHDRMRPGRNALVRMARKRWPTLDDPAANAAWVEREGRRWMTPLVPALIMVLSAEVLLAINATAAVLAVTREPFIILAATAFSLMGLRALYFALAGLMHRFYYFRISLVVLLMLAAAKLIAPPFTGLSPLVGLAVTASVILGGVTMSALLPAPKAKSLISPLGPNVEGFTRLTVLQAQKMIALVIGSTLVLIGIAMLILPGPASVMIPAGLAVLGTQFVWARRVMRQVRQETGEWFQEFRDPKWKRDPRAWAWRLTTRFIQACINVIWSLPGLRKRNPPRPFS